MSRASAKTPTTTPTFAEAVAAFCLSSELCEEEDDAEAKAQELLKALGRGAAKAVEAEAAVAQGTKTAGAFCCPGRREECLYRGASCRTCTSSTTNDARTTKREETEKSTETH